MSAREWRQGDVAIRTTSPHMSFRDECRTIAVHCYDDSHGPDLHWHHDHGGWDSIPDGDLYEPTYRPLVVIDPEDREQVDRLTNLMWSTFEAGRVPFCTTDMRPALREFANPTPPRPDEPLGLGAVVEDADGVRWYLLAPHIADRRWACWDEQYGDRDYDEINAVRILSAGVES